MSGRILYRNPQVRSYVSKNHSDGKFESRAPGIVQINQPVENKPQKQPGPVVLTQKPEDVSRRK